MAKGGLLFSLVEVLAGAVDAAAAFFQAAGSGDKELRL